MPSFPWAKRASQQPSSSYQDDRNPTLPNLSPSNDSINYDDSPDLSSYDTDPRQASTTFDGILNNSSSRDRDPNRGAWLRTPSILGGKAPSTHRQQADSIAGEEYYDPPAQHQTSPKSTASNNNPAPRKSFRAKLSQAFTSRDNLAEYANAEEGAGEKPARKRSVLRKGAPSSYRDPGGSPNRGGGAGGGAAAGSWGLHEQEPSLPRIAGGFQGEEYDSTAMERKQDESDSLRPDAWVQSSQPQQQPQTTRMMDRSAGYTLASSPAHGHAMEQAQQYTSLTGNRPSSRLGLKDERPASPGRAGGGYPEQPTSSPARQRQDPLGSPMIARQTQQPARPNSSTPLVRGGVLSQLAQPSPLDRMSQQPSTTASPIIRTPTLSRDDAVSPPAGSAPASSTNDASKELEVLKIKYMNVKRQYFTQKRQLESLQETLATANLSASRTSLDDTEYIKRLDSLDGSVRDLAFSIRKHWRSLPDWLVPCVSPDAARQGGKEMIAAGRAFVSRWLYEEVFERCFHPALPAELSRGLKTCQRELSRPLASTSTTASTSDDTSRATTWRLATLDGLASLLNPSLPSTSAAIAAFTSTYTSLLVEALKQHLSDPLSEGVRIEASVAGVVEAAVRIAVHLPLESREVVVEYHFPDAAFEGAGMKVESGGLGALGGGAAGGGLKVVGGSGRKRATSRASTNGSTYEDALEVDESAEPGHDDDETMAEQDVGRDGAAGVAGGGFKKSMASAAAAASSAVSARKSEDSAGGTATAAGAAGSGATAGSAAMAGKKVRMCVFLGARIRGNGKGRVLTQAPVFVA